MTDQQDQKDMTPAPEPEEKEKQADGSTLSAVLEKKNEDVPFETAGSEKLEGSRIRYDLKVEGEYIKSRTDEVLQDFSKNVSIPGFRAGRAPLSLIRNRYGKGAREEAIQRIAQRLAEMVGEKEDLEVLAEPDFNGWEDGEGDSAIVKVTLEVRPQIEITDETLKDLKVEATENPVTDDAVERELENLRLRNATYEAVDEEAVFGEEDALSMDIEVFDEEGSHIRSLEHHNHYSQDVKSDLPGNVASALVGHKRGDVVECPDTPARPDDPGAPKLTYKVTIHEIKKRVLPELDDELAKDISPDFETLSDLKDRIRKDMEEEESARKRSEVLDGVFKLLRERLDFDLPPTLVENMAHRSVSEMERRFNRLGMSLKSLPRESIGGLVQRARTEAKDDVKNLLIADQVGRVKEIEVTDEVLDEEIRKAAEAEGRKPLALRASLEKQRRLDDFRADLRVRKINDLLYDLAQVTIVEKKEQEPEQQASGQQEPEEQEKE